MRTNGANQPALQRSLLLLPGPKCGGRHRCRVHSPGLWLAGSMAALTELCFGLPSGAPGWGSRERQEPGYLWACA